MRRLSYANVASTLALVVALSGTSYAAVTLPRNSVGTKQLKAHAVTTVKNKSHAVTAKNIKAGVIPPGYAPGTTLKPGQTLTGVYDVGVEGTTYGVTTVSFHPKLARPLTNAFREHFVPGATSDECPGPGKAMRGFLCVYDTWNANGNLVWSSFLNPADGTDDRVAVDGFGLLFYNRGPVFAVAKGVWALTAP